MICPGLPFQKKRRKIDEVAAEGMQYKVEKNTGEKNADSEETLKTQILFRRKPEYDTGQHANQ
ncbi:hypothetical protein NNRS527_01108 [Nitrosospira sp. NRS527]|nr:hypothetical protein NNRS527_01108 [Nitrosospira sp. NRS527]